MRESAVIDARLEAAVRADVVQGEMPMPMSAIALRGALEYGAQAKARYFARICCHRCGRKEESGQPYCALAAKVETGEIMLECISCLVLSATEDGIATPQVTEYVDGRFMGSMQTCSMLQGFARGGMMCSGESYEFY